MLLGSRTTPSAQLFDFVLVRQELVKEGTSLRVGSSAKLILLQLLLCMLLLLIYGGLVESLMHRSAVVTAALGICKVALVGYYLLGALGDLGSIQG